MRRPIKLSLILVVLACVYLVLPFLFGIAAQRSTMNFLHNENETLGKALGIHLDFVQYNRGWFHSTAVLQIEKTATDGDLEIIKKIPVVVNHGPVYRVRNHFLMGLGAIHSDNLTSDTSASYQISFQDNIGFDGERGAFIFASKKSSGVLPDNLQINSLILHIQSNLKATQFLFELDGHGLHYQDPTQPVSASIQDVLSHLKVNYLGDHHWQYNLGAELLNSQFSAPLSDNTTDSMTMNINKINFSGMHFDSQKMVGITGELIQLKQATDTDQSVKPTAWMAFLQQVLTQIIQSDTQAQIEGFSITSPMGTLRGNYNVSFPTLPDKHDYFDVATRNVGALNFDIPQWTYTNAEKNTEFTLHGFQYHDSNDTVFARHSNMMFDLFEINNLTPAPKTKAFSAAGLKYQGELRGDTHSLSQTMQWQLEKLCFADSCFDQWNSKLEFLKMNYDAFRGIATATQRVVQYNPHQTEALSARWIDLANAYVKLISPQTQVILLSHLITPDGPVQINGTISWPTLNADSTVPPTAKTFLNDSVYDCHVLFPVTYVNAFLNQPMTLTVSKKQNSKTPSFEAQVKQFVQYALSQGYLKKEGDAYTVDLSGKGSVVTINGVPWKMPR